MECPLADTAKGYILLRDAGLPEYERDVIGTRLRGCYGYEEVQDALRDFERRILQPPDVEEEEDDDLPCELCDSSSEGDVPRRARCDSSEDESSDDSSDDDNDFEWTQRLIHLHAGNAQAEVAGEDEDSSLLLVQYSFQGVDFDAIERTFIGLQMSPMYALVDTGAQHAVVGPTTWKQMKQYLATFGLKPRKVPTIQMQAAGVAW